MSTSKGRYTQVRREVLEAKARWHRSQARWHEARRRQVLSVVRIIGTAAQGNTYRWHYRQRKFHLRRLRGINAQLFPHVIHEVMLRHAHRIAANVTKNNVMLGYLMGKRSRQ